MKSRFSFLVGACFTLIACDGPTAAENQTVNPWVKAAQNGVEFRGTGNEPPWIVELSAGKMVLLTGYDKNRTEQPYVVNGLSYYTQDYTVTKGLGPCHDSMSGEEFKFSVTIQSEHETLKGCGRDLR
ncbi:hypothetical protein [Terasakiella sp.]|uniref:hypothetical protein n=1 Tax=Terasakiella sp. TaxID=2034861 RepID=UPI003AA88FCB